MFTQCQLCALMQDVRGAAIPQGNACRHAAVLVSLRPSEKEVNQFLAKAATTTAAHAMQQMVAKRARVRRAGRGVI